MNSANDNIPGAIERRRQLRLFNLVLAGLIGLFALVCLYIILNMVTLSALSQVAGR